MDENVWKEDFWARIVWIGCFSICEGVSFGKMKIRSLCFDEFIRSRIVSEASFRSSEEKFSPFLLRFRSVLKCLISFEKKMIGIHRTWKKKLLTFFLDWKIVYIFYGIIAGEKVIMNYAEKKFWNFRDEFFIRIILYERARN